LCTLEPVVSRQSPVVRKADSSQPSAVSENQVVSLQSLRLAQGKLRTVDGEETAVSAQPPAISPTKFATPNVVLINQFIAGPGFSNAVEDFRSPATALAKAEAANPQPSAVRQPAWDEIGAYNRSRPRVSTSNFQLPMKTTHADFQSPIGNRNSQISSSPTLALRLGLKYVRGLREAAAQALVRERSLAPFQSIHDLTRRVPELRKDELATLAEVGALNFVRADAGSITSRSRILSVLEPALSEAEGCLRGEKSSHSKPETRNSKLTFHRRDALWQVEKAVRRSGPLLEEFPEPDVPSPLAPMTHEERLVADFHGTGLTVGPHPMAYRRPEMKALGIHPASELKSIPSGQRLRIGGCVIARQRPGTAKGFVFLSLEDETGIANAIVTPDILQSNRVLLISERFLMVEGILQNQDNVISVKAERVLPLFVTRAETSSHDFH